MILLGFSRWIFQKNYGSLNSLESFVDNQENFLPFAFFVNLILGILFGLLLFPFVEIPLNFGAWTLLSHITIVVMGVVLYFVFRFLINSFLIYLLGMDEHYKKIFKVKVFFRVFAIFALLICTFLLYYSDFQEKIIFLIALGILLITLVLEYFYQLRKTGATSIYGSYYFILYLCVLEILPILYVVMHWKGVID